LHEASLPFEAKLSPHGIPVSGSYIDFDGQLDFPVSAHPRLIQSSNHSTLVFHAYSGDPSHLKASNGSSVKYGELNTDTNQLTYYHGLKGLEKIVPFMHDFIVTEKYIVFFKTSVLLDAAEAFFGKKEGPPEIFKFFPEENFQIAVVSRDPQVCANVTWITLPYPAVIVHTLNGWDMAEDGKITAWAPLGYTFDGTLAKKNTNRYYMTEMIIDLKTETMTPNIISKDYNVEFPRVRDECVGKPCRYGFSGVINDDDLFHGFVRIDTQEKSMCFTPYQWGEKKFIGGEPVIIPKKGKEGSDEIYIGSFVIDSTTGENYFGVWDGQRCNGDAVVVLKTPRVPLGFHGNWITPEQFSKHLQN
jgi:carotenoid cleavage dioxygenase-like enzyme